MPGALPEMESPEPGAVTPVVIAACSTPGSPKTPGTSESAERVLEFARGNSEICFKSMLYWMVDVPSAMIGALAVTVISVVEAPTSSVRSSSTVEEASTTIRSITSFLKPFISAVSRYAPGSSAGML